MQNLRDKFGFYRCRVPKGPEEALKTASVQNEESCETKMFIEEICYCLSSIGIRKIKQHKSGRKSWNQVRKIESNAHFAQGED